MSAPLALSWSATWLDSLTMSVIVSWEIPAGDTSSGRCSVTAPMKPTLTLPNVLVQLGVRARALLDLIRTLSAR